MKNSGNSAIRTDGWRSRLVARWATFVMPTLLGLPNWRVVLWFPVAAALGSAVLIAFGLSGTSSGAHWAVLGSGPDPRLLDGIPRGIRADEWLVQQGWVVSQVNRGFPPLNSMFPGGTDMTVLNELPSWDWSSLFRPHLWGYLFFGLNVGMAWHWWIPALALVSACYLFAVTILPRRPMLAAFLAVAVFFTPFLQWWFTPSTLFSLAWPFFAMTSIVWILVDDRRWVRVSWSVLTGYLAVTLAMGLYVPYIIPGLLVFLSFSIGYLLRAKPWLDGGPKAALRRLFPLLLAGLAAVSVTAIWALTRLSTFTAILSTVYPGQRLVPTGTVRVGDPYLTGIAGAPWNQALKAVSGTTVLGLNSSEASTVIMLSLFLLPGLIWFALKSCLPGRRIDWLLLSCIAVFLLIAAYLLVPGWDALAHLLQLDRVPPERFRIVFVVLLPLFLVLTVDQIDRFPSKFNWIVGVACGSLAALITLITWGRIRTVDPAILGMAPTWKIIAVLIVATVVLVFLRRGATAGAGLLLVASVLMGWGINPIYRGVFDLSKTETGIAIDNQDESEPGTWVGVGSYETMALLVQSSVQSFSGVQNYPSDQMWKQIDPRSEFENEWNRLGQINWTFGNGAPQVENPQPNAISVTLDPCSSFAQDHVSYVLSDVLAPPDTCLVQRSLIKQGLLDMRIYEVVPPTS